MSIPVNALAVANYFIRRSIDSGTILTPMKLIKLVYIAHGWHLGITNKPLLPEGIEAWQYGPVVPSIYNEFKKYGKEPVTEMFYDYNSKTYPFPTDGEIVTFLDKIWNVYGKYDGLQLSALTHQKDTPWYITWNQLGGRSSRAVMISDDLIKQHYKNKIAAAQQPNAAN